MFLSSDQLKRVSLISFWLLRGRLLPPEVKSYTDHPCVELCIYDCVSMIVYLWLCLYDCLKCEHTEQLWMNLTVSEANFSVQTCSETLAWRWASLSALQLWRGERASCRALTLSLSLCYSSLCCTHSHTHTHTCQNSSVSSGRGIASLNPDTVSLVLILFSASRLKICTQVNVKKYLVHRLLTSYSANCFTF